MTETSKLKNYKVFQQKPLEKECDVHRFIKDMLLKKGNMPLLALGNNFRLLQDEI